MSDAVTNAPIAAAVKLTNALDTFGGSVRLNGSYISLSFPLLFSVLYPSPTVNTGA